MKNQLQVSGLRLVTYSFLVGSVSLISMGHRVLPPVVLSAGLRSKFVRKIELKRIVHLHSMCGRALFPLITSVE